MQSKILPSAFKNQKIKKLQKKGKARFDTIFERSLGKNK